MDIISTVIREGEVGSVCVGLSDVPTNGTEVAINVTFTVGNGDKAGRHKIYSCYFCSGFEIATPQLVLMLDESIMDVQLYDVQLVLQHNE